ncbi:MAG: hypothetical protein ACM3TT_01625 [Syntrophothermus sp.]
MGKENESKENDSSQEILDALLAAGQGEEVMAVVPAEIQPGIATIAQETGMAEEASLAQEDSIAREAGVSEGSSPKQGLIVWKGFPKK